MAFGVRTDLPDDLVYQITAALAKHKDDFHQIHRTHVFYDPKIAWRDVGGAPLHPGAERFYREMGYLKSAGPHAPGGSHDSRRPDADPCLAERVRVGAGTGTVMAGTVMMAGLPRRREAAAVAMIGHGVESTPVAAVVCRLVPD